MNKRKLLIMDEEYWSIEPMLDKLVSVFGEDCFDYCADGSAGLDKLSHTDYKCIILDIMFPLGPDFEENEESFDSIRGGLILLKNIRKVLNKTTPIICFTIRDDDDVKAEIQRYENSFHISKLNVRAMDLLIVQLKRYIN